MSRIEIEIRSEFFEDGTGLCPCKIFKELKAGGAEDAKRSYGARCWHSCGIFEDLKARGPEKC